MRAATRADGDCHGCSCEVIVFLWATVSRKWPPRTTGSRPSSPLCRRRCRHRHRHRRCRYLHRCYRCRRRHRRGKRNRIQRRSGESVARASDLTNREWIGVQAGEPCPRAGRDDDESNCRVLSFRYVAATATRESHGHANFSRARSASWLEPSRGESH